MQLCFYQESGNHRPGGLFTFLWSSYFSERHDESKKSTLIGPDRGQRNGRDYEQHRVEEARGGEGRIVLCNHVDQRWLSSIPLIKSGGVSLLGGISVCCTHDAKVSLQAIWRQNQLIKKKASDAGDRFGPSVRIILVQNQTGSEANMVSVCFKSIMHIRKGHKNLQTAIKMMLILFIQKSNLMVDKRGQLCIKSLIKLQLNDERKAHQTFDLFLFFLSLSSTCPGWDGGQLSQDCLISSHLLQENNRKLQG